MVKTMKRSLSMLLALLMLLCVFPVSTFAADSTITEGTITVGKNKAPVRKSPYQDGEVIERPKEGKSLTCTGLHINSKQNLRYEVKCSDGSTGYLYSGNVKNISTAEGAKIPTTVDLHRDLLTHKKCLEQAEKLLASGYPKEQIAQEIFAHAYAYYKVGEKFNNRVKTYVTDALLCTLFPDRCLSVVTVTTMLTKFGDWSRKHGDPVNIGGSTTIAGYELTESDLQTIFAVLWKIT